MKLSKIIFCLGLMTAYAFVFQNARGVWEPSEGRYVCVATEMIRNGDWTYPHLSDALVLYIACYIFSFKIPAGPLCPALVCPVVHCRSTRT